mgnify:CR=1 FL=1
MVGTKKVRNLNLVKEQKEKVESKVSALSPREIVSELDRYVIGQKDAKKAVAVALRNRWRRQALSDEMRDEVLPKNILMIGPTGVGKTEISRRLSKLAEAPFIKVEATRFTEVGYVGRDVEQIIRDLIEIAIAMEREKKRKEVKAKAELKAEEKVLDALIGNKASVATRESFRKRLRTGDLDHNEIEIEVQNTSSPLQNFEIPGMPGGNVGMVNLGDKALTFEVFLSFLTTFKFVTLFGGVILNFFYCYVVISKYTYVRCNFNRFSSNIFCAHISFS